MTDQGEDTPAVKEFKIDEYGRNRKLGPKDGFVIIPGNRVMKHWNDFLEDRERHLAQIGFTSQQVEDFYHGWIKPIALNETGHCGHKGYEVSTGINATNLNIIDIFDLAVNTPEIIPDMIPGSSAWQYNGPQEVVHFQCGSRSYPIEHNDSVSYDVDVFRTNPLSIGVRALLRGEYNSFTLDLTEWSAVKALSEYFDESVIKASMQRFARVFYASTGGQIGASHRLPIHKIYPGKNDTNDDIPAIAKLCRELSEFGISDEEAAFLIILMYTRNPTGVLDFTLTEHIRERLRDDSFVTSLLPLMRDNAVPIRKGWAMVSPKGNLSMDMMLTVAEHDIDLSIVNVLSLHGSHA